MSSQPKVSILIPCYNAERWVAQAIQSALDQTHENKEVIVVDDGSTDGSLQIIKSFENKIKWETGPNRGGNVARNRLFELSTGTWLQYLDADDYLKRDKITEQIDAAESFPSQVDAVYSPAQIETWRGGKLFSTTSSLVNPNQSIEEQWIRWNVAQTGTVLWKRTSLLEIGGWNNAFTCCQDNEITFRSIRAGHRFLFSASTGAVYRIWSNETVCRQNPKKVIETRTLLIEAMLKHLSKTSSILPAHRIAAGAAFFEMSRTLATHDISAAQRYARRSNKISTLVLEGDAAQPMYRFVYRLLGFRFAETIANIFRR